MVGPRQGGEEIRRADQLEHASSASSGGNKAEKTFVDPKKLAGVVVDDDDAQLTGEWKNSSAAPSYVGNGYRHDDKTNDGKASARFETKLPKSGRYEVLVAYPPNANRSSKVSVEVHSADGKKTIQVDQRQTPTVDDRFHSVGQFEFDAATPAAVVISNANSNGYVVIDAEQWLPKIGSSSGQEERRSRSPGCILRSAPAYCADQRRQVFL